MRSTFAPLLVLAAVAACDPQPGRIAVTVYGEAYVEEGIPSDVFVDGWAVSFDLFLVSIGGAATQAGHDTPELTVPGYQVFDLSQPSGGRGFTLATLDAPAGNYDHFGYVIRPDPEATPGNADPIDVAGLKASGRSVRIRGTAHREADGALVWFDWSFAPTITHAHCNVDRTVDGDTVTMQATIHADHLFHDDLVSETPNVAFDLIAASDGADGSAPDGTVTQVELGAKDIRGETRYQVGSFAVENLGSFIAHQVGTLGHVNGEGHCEDILVQ